MQNLKFYSSNNELFKVENFTNKDINTVIETLYKFLGCSDEDIEESIEYFEIGDEILIFGEFKEAKQAYIYVDSQGYFTITDNLNTFSEGYKTEKEWGIEKWTEI